MSVLFHPTAAPLRLGYLSPHNPYDRRAFSGTSFFAARALAAHPGIDLRILGAHRVPRRIDRFLRRQPVKLDVEDVDAGGLDAVLGIAATPLLDALARRRPDLPLLHVTDATPRFLRDVYGWDVPLDADRREARLARHAAATIYSSPEMAARAPGDLEMPGFTPHAQPFGINLEAVPGQCPEKPPLDTLRLLFVGLDWERKGGDIAVATLDRLTALGIDAELTLVGRPPAHLGTRPGIRIAGFLDKNRPREAQELVRLYRQAHLLILPSRADCTPMVVAEAMIHGTPVIGAETGGLASLLGGKGTGEMLPASAGPDEWARAIHLMTARPGIYAMLSEAAFDRASKGLDWRSWADAMYRIARNASVKYRPEAGAA